MPHPPISRTIADPRRNASLLAMFLLSLLSLGQQQAEPVFRYDPGKIETGVVYQYTKSNIDGSKPERVSLYVAAPDKLESLKWHEGGTKATLVVATMDWSRFSVRRFETYELRRQRPTLRRAVLNSSRGSRVLTATIRSQKMEVRVDHWPWHSYDFDLASLNFAFRHLVDPERPFTIGIVDAVRDDDGEIDLVDKGEVTITFRRRVRRGGFECREYAINGPGLENRGGTLWIRKGDGVLVDYEIALPDEEGYQSGKLVLTSQQTMTAEAWEDYKKQSVARR